MAHCQSSLAAADNQGVDKLGPHLKPPSHYFIVTLASAIAAGMFGGGGHGPDSTSTKATLSEIGTN
jgi:hypothetical protein